MFERRVIRNSRGLLLEQPMDAQVARICVSGPIDFMQQPMSLAPGEHFDFRQRPIRLLDEALKQRLQVPRHAGDAFAAEQAFVVDNLESHLRPSKGHQASAWNRCAAFE